MAQTLEPLRERWMRLLSAYVEHDSYASASFDSLVDRHSQDERRYHTIEHVDRVVSLIEDLCEVPSSAPDTPTAVELAGFFHDVVFDPRAHDNKERSAGLAAMWLDGLGVPPDLVEETRRLILLTEEHDAPPGDRNAAVLLDADLALLGADPAVYDRYLDDLRREHGGMSDREYGARRRGQLEQFLAREQIFRTTVCRNMFESAARANLRRELQLLGPPEETLAGSPAQAAVGPAADDGARGGDEGYATAETGARDAATGTPVPKAPKEQPAPRGPHRFLEGLRGVRRLGAGVVVLCLLAIVFVAVQLLRPAPSLDATLASPGRFAVPGRAGLPWPTQGQAVVDAVGLGSLGGVGAEVPVPIASLTKVMTALVVLRDHPLALGTAGPLITISPPDVATYQSETAAKQSVIAVAPGERLSELQALEGLLVGSGNNIAELLATWDAGGTAAFVAKMNGTARFLGLSRTHYTGPSGAEDTNVASASDQARLVQAALGNPVFAQIVAMAQVTLPVSGVVYNYDYDLGRDGIVGVKTGSSAAAGGCFVFAARRPVGLREVSVVGAVLGQQGQAPLQSALDAADALVKAAFFSLKPTTLVHRGEIVGRVIAPWGASTPLEAAGDVALLGAPGMEATMTLAPSGAARSVRAGAGVGQLTVYLGAEHLAVTALASGAVPGPSFTWRLARV